MVINETVLNEVFDFFEKSKDFNGISFIKLKDILSIDYNDLIEIIKQEVNKENVSIQSDINPHIIRLGHYALDTQIQVLEEVKNNVTNTSNMDGVSFSVDNYPICIYPSPSYLNKRRDTSKFNGLPYTLKLALGEPQLKAYFFEIEVLDRYFKDPRFSFVFRDFSGQIAYDYEENGNYNPPESEDIFIQTFGTGIDVNEDRVAVVYLRYLKDLTPEHQLYWKSKEVNRECKVLFEYYTSTIEGNWINSHSVFTAFLEEQKALNDLTEAIFSTPLFNKTFERENRPEEFTFFFTPTLKNYYDFISVLDKMISDNINKDFFKNQGFEMYEFTTIENNMIERKEKGTLRIFEEWLLSNYNVQDVEPLKNLFKPFKKIRKERQTPAHRITWNYYDKKFTNQQKEMIKELYYIMNTFRKIFQQHPLGISVKIPKWLDEGDIKMI